MNIFSKKLLAVSIVLAASGASTIALAGSTTMVSLTPQKIVGNATSSAVSLSKGGTQSAFTSSATNLVLQDGNNAPDIFLRIGTSVFQRVSVNSLGQEASNSVASWYDIPNYADSTNASISSDGKLVVFQSNADNLDRLTADINNNTGAGSESDVFLRDVSKKKTYRLSGIMDGADGVITSGLLDVTNVPVTSVDAPWKIITAGNAQSYNPVIAGTAKAAWVAFGSRATNLTGTLTTTTNRRHIYAMDLKTKKLELIDATHDVAGVPLVEADANSNFPAISPDGRFVTFQSAATNLTAPSTSTGSINVFVYDRKMFKMYQLSGVLGVASPTGGFTVTGEPDDNSANPSITGGGTSKTKSYMIAFESLASDLDAVPGGDGGGDSDVFVAEFAAVDPKNASTDFEIKSVKRISAPLDSAGVATAEAAYQDDGTASSSTAPVIGGTSLAYTVAFTSDADNLLPDPLSVYWSEDSNDAADIYVYSSKTKTFSRANVDIIGEQGTNDAANAAISPDGKAVGFDVNDDYLTPNSLGAGNQVYLRKL